MKRPVFGTIITFLALSVIGYGLIPRIALRYIPSVQESSITVSYQWPQASPALVEQKITTPLEGSFELVEGIEKISSVSRQGSGRITMELSKNRSVDYIRFDVASRIRQLYPQLPKAMSYPVLSLKRPDDQKEIPPILVYTLSGAAAPSIIFDYADRQIQPQLALEDGMDKVLVTGSNRTEWLIRYNQQFLNTLGLTVYDIISALQEKFRVENLGLARLQDRSFSIGVENLNGNSVKSEDLMAIPLVKQKGRLLTVGDVADIQLQEQLPTQYFRINGKNSVRLSIYAEPTANNIDLAKRIKSKIKTIAGRLPSDYELILEQDNTIFLQKELDKIWQRTGLSLAILLVFVLIIYRSAGFLMMVLLSLLVNLGMALAVYYLLEVELNLYALAGITVSFGIMIDNTLVMMHHLEKQNNLRVFPALLASTLTTIGTLLAIYFLPEEWKIKLWSFAQVMMINLGLSLMVSLLLIPALMEIWKRRIPQRSSRRNKRGWVRINHFYEKMQSGILRYRWAFIMLVILGFGLPVYKLPNQIKNWEWYNKTLGNEYYVENIKPIVNRALGGTLRLFDWYVYEGSAYREPSETFLYVNGRMPQGATIHQLNAVFEQMESYVAQYPEAVKSYQTQIYSGQNGSMRIAFKDRVALTFPYRLKGELQAYAINLQGVKWSIYGVGRGFSTGSYGSIPSFRVNVYGYNRNILAEQVQRFANRLLEHPRIQKVETDALLGWRSTRQYAYFLDLNEKALAIQGLNKAQFMRELDQFNITGNYALSLKDGTPVRMVSLQQENRDLWQLQNQAIKVDSNRLSVGKVARIQKRATSNAIYKENQQYIQPVEFEYTGSGRFGSRYLDKVMKEMKEEFPLGYYIERREYTFGEEKKQFNSLVFLSTILVFFICSIHFNSLRQAFSIVVLIPISFIGIFLTFYLFDFPFDQGGYASFILVAGLVVNSMILLVSDYNRFRKRHPGRSALVTFRQALNHKLTPILLTIISTILGLIPFMLDGQQEVFWFALAAGTIGGLLFSVFLIIMVIPLFFVAKQKGGD